MGTPGSGRFPSGLTLFCDFPFGTSERGRPLLRMLESRSRPWNGFDCRQAIEAIGRQAVAIAVNELPPHFGFVRAQFPRRPVPLRGILSRPIPRGPG